MKLRKRLGAFLAIAMIPFVAAHAAFNSEEIKFNLQMSSWYACAWFDGACYKAYWTAEHEEWSGTFAQYAADYQPYYATGQCNLPQQNSICLAFENDLQQLQYVVVFCEQMKDQY